MKPVIDATHDADRKSWVESANVADCEFPIQNLPFGRFRSAAGDGWRIGVAIGEQVLDLQRTGLIAPAEPRRQLMGSLPAQRLSSHRLRRLQRHRAARALRG